MELSIKDRLILVNQYKILKMLDEEEEEPRYDELIEILVNGYEIFYSNFVEYFLETPRADSRLVFDVLDMYRAIENYKRENPKDIEIMKHHYGHFVGFDGNDEAGLLLFLKFLLEKQRKYDEELAYRESTGDFNSHAPTIKKYSQMLEKWKELGKKFELSREAVLAIIIDLLHKCAIIGT